MPEIELRLHDLNQVYDTLDPAPFPSKALDRNIESYLLASVGEHSHYEHLHIVIQGPPILASHLPDIRDAIHAHFALAHQLAEQRYRRRRRIGRIALTMGMMTLAVALLFRQWVVHWGSPVGEILAEGLLILAWVALWRPIETIGFDSWESREERRMLAALATVAVRFQAAQDPRPNKTVIHAD